MHDLEKSHILVVCRTKHEAGILFKRWVSHVKSTVSDCLFPSLQVSTRERIVSNASVSCRFVSYTEVYTVLRGSYTYMTYSGYDISNYLDAVEKERET